MARGKFWMVLGSGQPSYRHPSKQSAKIEAERLALSHPEQDFIVLESLATVRKTALTWELNEIDGSITADGEVPF